jgi:translation initiation factor 3 subunit C
MERIYYKHDTVAAAVKRAHVFNKKFGTFADIHPACSKKILPNPDDVSNVEKTHPAAVRSYPTLDEDDLSLGPSPEAVLNELSQYIYKFGDERLKTRALLCMVFHHALHDRFYRARDLFLISHIQDVIDKADAKTQILYNRVLATLGLSAFRLGLIQKAHDCLAGICGGRPLQVKEMLAQGQARWSDKDPEQERIERRRLMPYHMHINPDLLDCCWLTCAMLLELPQLAKGGSVQTWDYSAFRNFRKVLQQSNRQVFTGPPENTREHVLAACKALLSGDWERASEYILNVDAWNLIPNDGGDKVKAMLRERIKEEAVRTYLLSSGTMAYDSISLDYLCDKFNMAPGPTRKIVSKMIFDRELEGAWEGDKTLVLSKETHNQMQTLSLRVSDKMASLVDSNERMLDHLNGGQMFGYRDELGRLPGNQNRQYQHRDHDGDRSKRFAKSGASGRNDFKHGKGGRGKKHYGDNDGGKIAWGNKSNAQRTWAN